MSPEERQLLADLFDRIGKASAQPRDKDAEAFISEAVKAQPYAPYLLAQSVIVQDQALRAATDRLQQLEAQNRDLTAKLQPGQSQPQGGGGFLSGIGSLFGGGAQPAPQQQAPQQSAPQRPSSPWGAAPQQYAPSQPAMQAAPQQQAYQPAAPAGGGFLKGAMGTAAGVAGGVLAANAISGLFHGGGHGTGGGLGGGGAQAAGLGGGDTVVNNYYGDNHNPQTASNDGYDNGGGDNYTSDADYVSDSSDSDGGYDV